MTGSTHVAMGLAGSLVIMATGGPGPEGGQWVALVAGTLGPDIDGLGTVARPGSLLGKLLPRPVAWLLDQVGLLVSRLVRAILGHRGATHWPLVGLGLLMAGVGLGQGWLAWLGAGWLWHIAGDFCTRSGVPLLGPIWTKNIRWSPLRTGSWGEFLIALGLWGVIVHFGFSYLPPGARDFILRFGAEAKHLISEVI